jgi:hypothetical protein
VSQALGVAAVEAAAEPFDALLGRPVRPGLGVDPPARLILKAADAREGLGSGVLHVVDDEPHELDPNARFRRTP